MKRRNKVLVSNTRFKLGQEIKIINQAINKTNLILKNKTFSIKKIKNRIKITLFDFVIFDFSYFLCEYFT